MASSFGSFEIARSGLTVNERGLNVTGHNISNVNTPGYVRQQAMIKNGSLETVYTKTGAYQIGLGSDIEEIRQIRNSFLDNIYRKENTTLGYWESRQKTFQDVQAIIAEPINSGLQDTLNQFWDSWQELSKDPNSLTVRALVSQRGSALVSQINHMGVQLDRLQSDLNSEISVRINEVNQITTQIAKLNVSILKSEVTGDSANDYRDQRNTLIDRLTKLANVDVNEMQDGQADVTIGGYYVVQKGTSTDLVAAERNTGDMFYVPKLKGTNIEVPLKNGIIKGLMESRGEVSGAVGSYQNGTPDTKADVVFVIDTSTSSTLYDKATNTVNTAYIDAYKAEMIKKGIDCNVQTVQADTTAGFNDLTVKINGITGLRSDANKYAMIFTNKDISAPADITGVVNALGSQGMEASVATTAAPTGWTNVTTATNGSLYDIAATDYSALMNNMADATNTDVNKAISVIPESNNIVSDMKKRLNALVNVLMRQVNYLHKSGMTLGDPPTQGSDLFTVINTGRPLEMGNIQLNPNLSNLNNIAASKDSSSGDNSNALDIANLRNQPMIQDVDGILSTDDYYQSIILTMGNSGSDADTTSQNQNKLVQSADAYRTSITGVSMDEEMSNMMKYKFAYDASSKVLSTLDQMLQTIVERMGLAGR